MSIERVMQRILLALVAMAIAASAWGDEIGEAGRLPVGTVAAEDGETDALSDMLRSEELSLGLIVGALALALFLGAAHGLEPGHGKTIVAAYLVGARGTVGNALFLGGVVALTHTSSVILLGLVALFASQYILPEQIFPWLGTASGLLIMGLGTWLLVNHLRGRSLVPSHAHERASPRTQPRRRASPRARPQPRPWSVSTDTPTKKSISTSIVHEHEPTKKSFSTSTSTATPMENIITDMAIATKRNIITAMTIAMKKSTTATTITLMGNITTVTVIPMKYLTK